MASRKPTISAGAGTPAVHVGPRGGHYYVTHSGEKIYGEPPKAMLKAGKIKVLGWDDPNDMPTSYGTMAKTGGGGNIGAAAKPIPPKPPPPPPPKPVAPKPAPPPPPKPLPVVAKPVAPPKSPERITPKKETSARVKQMYEKLPADYQKALEDAGFDKLLAGYPARFRFNTRGGGGGIYRGGGWDSHLKGETPSVSFSPTDPKAESRPFQIGTGNRVAAINVHSTLIHEASHHLHYAMTNAAIAAFGPQKLREALPDSWISLSEAANRDGYQKFSAYSDKQQPEHPSVTAFENTPGGALTKRIRKAHERTITYSEGRLWPYVSRYAASSAPEWFAETHTVYVQKKEELRRFDPEAYALVRDVRLHMGMPE